VGLGDQSVHDCCCRSTNDKGLKQSGVLLVRLNPVNGYKQHRSDKGDGESVTESQRLLGQQPAFNTPKPL
jgi:hypothetical protein